MTRSLETHKPLHIRPTANPHTSSENAARHPPPSSTEAQGWAHHRPLQASTGPPFHGDGFHKSSGLGPLAFENTNPYRLGARGSPQHGEPLLPERQLQRTACQKGRLRSLRTQLVVSARKGGAVQRMDQHVTQPASSFHREREETASSCYLIKSLTFERHVFMPLRKAPFDLPATIEGGSSVVTRSLSTHKPLHIRPTANTHTSSENAVW